MLATLATVRARGLARWRSLAPLRTDAVLYGAAALFALVLARTSDQPAQWHWGYLAAAPYGALAIVAAVLGARSWGREVLVRVTLLALVIIGAVAVPLALEARWRQAQPEVYVIQRAGDRISHGQDPYQSYDRNGKLINAVKGVPAFESFFPYFPLMGVFGLPSAAAHRGNELSDARIVMSLMTLLAGLGAIIWLRAPPGRKIRVAQVLLALPTGALFLATGGDDMPILALMLLGVAALQRRSTWVGAIGLGAAAAMKLTAWPLAAGALLVTRRRSDERSWRLFAAIVGLIVAVTVLPFAVRSTFAFMSNVFAFPMGLTGVKSPAASPLPGHVLTQWAPVLRHVLVPSALVVGGVIATRYLKRHWPISLSQLLGLLSVAFAVAMCVATATRVGYVIYPLNLALWSWIVREAPVREPELVVAAS